MSLIVMFFRQPFVHDFASGGVMEHGGPSLFFLPSNLFPRFLLFISCRYLLFCFQQGPKNTALGANACRCT